MGIHNETFNVIEGEGNKSLKLTDLINGFFIRWKIIVTPTGNVKSLFRPEWTVIDIKDMVINELNDQLNQHKSSIKMPAAHVFNAAFNTVIINKKEIENEKLKQTLIFNNSECKANKLLQLWLGKDPEAKEVAVLKHFLWQVKRKMFNKEVKDHMMIILNGPQDKGKSTAIRKLLESLNDLQCESNLDTVTDTRSALSLSKFLVFFFDELQKIEKTDINALKGIITSKTVSYRPMGTNEIVPVNNKSTFIATINGYMDEKIVDSTGMRRFYQLTFRDNVDSTIWEQINNFNYIELWNSIDENQDNTFVREFKEEITELQKTYIINEPIQEFIEETELTPINNELHEISLDDVYGSWSNWCNKNGMKVNSKPWFSKQMNNRGLKTIRKTYNGIKTRFILVSPNNKLIEFNMKEWV